MISGYDNLGLIFKKLLFLNVIQKFETITYAGI